MDFLQLLFRYAVKPGDESNIKTPLVKVKKEVRFESEPLIQEHKCKKSFEVGSEKDDISRGPAVNIEKSGARVKILMKKEDAVRLLSKCKEGGTLEFKDVANEFVHIPNDRISFVVSSSNKKNV